MTKAFLVPGGGVTGRVTAYGTAVGSASLFFLRDGDSVDRIDPFSSTITDDTGAYKADGLMLYAYPLHPAGQPEKRRDAHLPRIAIPVLCVNGTRDTLCRRDLMEKALEPVTTAWQMHWIEGADHSLGTASVLEQIREFTRAWLGSNRE